MGVLVVVRLESVIITHRVEDVGPPIPIAVNDPGQLGLLRHHNAISLVILDPDSQTFEGPLRKEGPLAVADPPHARRARRHHHGAVLCHHDPGGLEELPTSVEIHGGLPRQGRIAGRQLQGLPARLGGCDDQRLRRPILFALHLRPRHQAPGKFRLQAIAFQLRGRSETPHPVTEFPPLDLHLSQSNPAQLETLRLRHLALQHDLDPAIVAQAHRLREEILPDPEPEARLPGLGVQAVTEKLRVNGGKLVHEIRVTPQVFLDGRLVPLVRLLELEINRLATRGEWREDRFLVEKDTRPLPEIRGLAAAPVPLLLQVQKAAAPDPPHR